MFGKNRMKIMNKSKRVNQICNSCDMIEDLVFRIKEAELSEYEKYRIFKAIENIKKTIKEF
jgi:hypothetical protein